MQSKRSIRRPTRWTPEEWSRVISAAKARGMAPLRFVREVTLACTEPDTCPLPEPRTAVWDELMHQLSRLLNNLQQIHLLAEDEGDRVLVALLARAIHVTEQAVLQAPTRKDDAAAVLEQIIQAGRLLNDMTHQTHGSEMLPSTSGAMDVIAEVIASVQNAIT